MSSRRSDSVNSRLPALIPMNRLDRAKGRLSGFLTPEERQALALATLETVLAAVEEAGWAPVVLTRDATVQAEVSGRALILVEVTPLLGLNAELEAALLRLQRRFPQPKEPRVLILHADLPLATGAAIASAAAATPPAPSTPLGGSAAGGTNPMPARPPG